MTSALNELTVILVTYNSAHILRSSLPLLSDVRHVLIVDNASTDSSVELVTELLPQARIIRNPENLGFGRANNIGLEHVTTPYALLLNPDCTIAPGSLSTLVEAAQRYPEAAILAPKIEATIGIPTDNFRPAFHVKLRPAVNLSMSGGDLCTDWLIGAAMFMNMRHMRRIGFFDPWFFLFYEEEDLCMRVRQAGLQIMVIPAAEAKHQSGQSTKTMRSQSFNRVYYLTISRLYLTRKQFGQIAFLKKFASVFLGSLLGLPLYAVLLNPRLVMRNLARLLAALRTPSELSRPHCRPLKD